MDLSFSTAETGYLPGPGDPANETAAERIVRLAWRTKGRPAPDGIHGEVHVRAEHGRWLVDCTLCNGAQLACAEDRRFFCVDCGHAGTASEGRWLKVIWPTNAQAIEEELLRRPDVRNRNWRQGESIEHLRAEFSAAQKLAVTLDAFPSLARSLATAEEGSSELVTGLTAPERRAIEAAR